MVPLFSLSPPFSWWLILHFCLIFWAFCFVMGDTTAMTSKGLKILCARTFQVSPGTKILIRIYTEGKQDGHIVYEIMCANALPELGRTYALWFTPRRLAMNPDVSWKGSADALFSFDMRCSSEAHSLWVAFQGLQLPFCCCTAPGFVLQSSHPPCQNIHHACLCKASSPLKDTVLICFDKEPLLWFVLQQGLLWLKISLEDRYVPWENVNI